MATLGRRIASALGDVVAFIFEPWRLPLRIRAAVYFPVAVVAWVVCSLILSGIAPRIAFLVAVVVTRTAEVAWLRRQHQDGSAERRTKSGQPGARQPSAIWPNRLSQMPTLTAMSQSRGEGWCMPLSEALLCGLPVIAPASTAMAEYLDQSVAELIPVHATAAADAPTTHDSTPPDTSTPPAPPFCTTRRALPPPSQSEGPPEQRAGSPRDPGTDPTCAVSNRLNQRTPPTTD